MARRGTLMILADVRPADEAEFNRWYDEEHMRERLEIPGFVSAQRYVSQGDSRLKYLALYETKSLAIFRSARYREALARQTDWSKRVLTKFRDPQRCVGEERARAGYGTAGRLSLFRLRPVKGAEEELRGLVSAKVLTDLASREGVRAASLIQSDPELSRPVAEYPQDGLRLFAPDDWFLTIGASDADALPPEPLSEVPQGLIDITEPLGRFDLLWSLHRTDLVPDA